MATRRYNDTIASLKRQMTRDAKVGGHVMESSWHVRRYSEHARWSTSLTRACVTCNAKLTIFMASWLTCGNDADSILAGARVIPIFANCSGVTK